MKIHCVAIILVTAAGTLFQITAVEWCICLLLFALVAGLELVNTAVEAVVDLVTEEKKPLAKKRKIRQQERYCLRRLFLCLSAVLFSFLMYLNWQKKYSDHQKRNV